MTRYDSFTSNLLQRVELMEFFIVELHSPHDGSCRFHSSLGSCGLEGKCFLITRAISILTSTRSHLYTDRTVSRDTRGLCNRSNVAPAFHPPSGKRHIFKWPWPPSPRSPF